MEQRSLPIGAAATSNLNSGSQAALLLGFGGPTLHLGSTATGHLGGDVLVGGEGSDQVVGRASGRDLLVGGFGAESVKAVADNPFTTFVREDAQESEVTKKKDFESAWSRHLADVDALFAEDPTALLRIPRR